MIRHIEFEGVAIAPCKKCREFIETGAPYAVATRSGLEGVVINFADTLMGPREGGTIVACLSEKDLSVGGVIFYANDIVRSLQRGSPLRESLLHMTLRAAETGGICFLDVPSFVSMRKYIHKIIEELSLINHTLDYEEVAEYAENPDVH